MNTELLIDKSERIFMLKNSNKLVSKLSFDDIKVVNYYKIAEVEIDSRYTSFLSSGVYYYYEIITNDGVKLYFTCLLITKKELEEEILNVPIKHISDRYPIPPKSRMISFE